MKEPTLLPGDILLEDDEFVVAYHRPGGGFRNIMLVAFALMSIFIITLPLTIPMLLWMTPPKHRWYYLTTRRAIYASSKEVKQVDYADLTDFKVYKHKGYWGISLFRNGGWWKHMDMFNLDDSRHVFAEILGVAMHDPSGLSLLNPYSGPLHWPDR